MAAAGCVWLDGPSRKRVSYPSLVQRVFMRAAGQALAACVRDVHVCDMHAPCSRTRAHGFCRASRTVQAERTASVGRPLRLSGPDCQGEPQVAQGRAPGVRVRRIGGGCPQLAPRACMCMQFQRMRLRGRKNCDVVLGMSFWAVGFAHHVACFCRWPHW